MTDVPMFDLDGTEHKPNDHAHTGPGCYFCKDRTATAAALAAGEAAYGAATPAFVKVFRRELWHKASGREPFTSVDILLTVRAMGYDTAEARAIGPIMTNAARLGFIVPTGRYVPSPDKAHHDAPKREWIGNR